MSITPYGKTMGIATLPAVGAFSRGWMVLLLQILPLWLIRLRCLRQKNNQLMSTDIIKKCIKEVQSELVYSLSDSANGDKLEREDSVFTMTKKLIAS